jgi:hypothetical protein
MASGEEKKGYCGDVDILSPDMIDKKTGNLKGKYTNGTTTLLIHATWCPHCVHLQPVFCKAWTKVLTNKGVFLLSCESKDDCYTKLFANRKIKFSGFPTILRFKNGVYDEQYQGERTADAIAKFMLA